MLAVTAPVSVADDPERWSVERHRWSVAVDGEVAAGTLAYPASVVPTTLVVLGHGCCGRRAAEAFNPLLHQLAAQFGVVAVVMDYRGSGGWDVARGARDLVEATKVLQARFPITRTIIWGVSMGGETTGMAVAERPELFDYWVASIGVMDLAQQWAVPGFRNLIEAETGGTPVSHPEAYRRRSPVDLAEAMGGIERAYLTHGVGDMIVPAQQSHAMHDALVDAGIKVSSYTVTTNQDGITGPIAPGLGLIFVPTPIGVAGHDDTSIEHSFAIVERLIAGDAPDAGEPSQRHFL